MKTDIQLFRDSEKDQLAKAIICDYIYESIQVGIEATIQFLQIEDDDEEIDNFALCAYLSTVCQKIGTNLLEAAIHVETEEHIKQAKEILSINDKKI